MWKCLKNCARKLCRKLCSFCLGHSCPWKDVFDHANTKMRLLMPLTLECSEKLLDVEQKGERRRRRRKPTQASHRHTLRTSQRHAGLRAEERFQECEAEVLERGLGRRVKRSDLPRKFGKLAREGRRSAVISRKCNKVHNVTFFIVIWTCFKTDMGVCTL